MQSKNDLTSSVNSLPIDLVDLFMSGLKWLDYIDKQHETIQFSKWSKVLRVARGQSNDLNRSQIIWLWEAITSEPGIKKRFGGRLISLKDEWKKIQPIECLPEKSIFGIFLKSFESMGYPSMPVHSTKRPDAEAVILAPLYMIPGTSRRFKCKDVPALLTIKLRNMGSEEEEAAALKVNKKDITIKNGCVCVNVKSLNHAYTKTSLRLEPHRRGPGGRAYDHVAQLKDDKFIPLEEIRLNLEKKQIFTD